MFKFLGKQQIISNINACCVVADAIRTTLGPRGLDKLIVNSKGVLFKWKSLFKIKIQEKRRFPTTEPPFWSCWTLFSRPPPLWLISPSRRTVKWAMERLRVCFWDIFDYKKFYYHEKRSIIKLWCLPLNWWREQSRSSRMAFIRNFWSVLSARLATR